ncbi:hypothetical protein G9464_08145 [Halostella sp. JP-L12]|uniref:DUF7344 domain-containing protein n=1 Tax=Halostella TaxID=1843185 RepID=UPI000EF84847|nr:MULTISPECIES: hypothetical protein [Halostella]NHN47566.1 hypothetical protein [Halostella sp. JP-L12]
MSTEDRLVGDDGRPLRRGPDDRPPVALSRDVVFELLSCRRRRLALYHLVDAESPVDFDDLVSRIVDWETGSLAPPRDHERTVSTALHHRHLPRLAEAGVVRYDADAGEIHYRPSPRLEESLADQRDDDLP